jgi:hypothetical protein
MSKFNEISMLQELDYAASGGWMPEQSVAVLPNFSHRQEAGPILDESAGGAMMQTPRRFSRISSS